MDYALFDWPGVDNYNNSMRDRIRIMNVLIVDSDINLLSDLEKLLKNDFNLTTLTDLNQASDILKSEKRVNALYLGLFNQSDSQNNQLNEFLDYMKNNKPIIPVFIMYNPSDKQESHFVEGMDQNSIIAKGDNLSTLIYTKLSSYLIHKDL